MIEQDFTNGQSSNQMVILVGDETTDDAKADADAGGAFHPSAPSYDINKATPNKPLNSVVKSPTLVHSYASVSLCTQSNTISVGSGITTADNLGNKNVDFRFCAYPFMDQAAGGGP
jgi:hypothetical protein